MDDPGFWLDLAARYGLPFVMALGAVIAFQREWIVPGNRYRNVLRHRNDLLAESKETEAIWRELALKGAFQAREAIGVAELAAHLPHRRLPAASEGESGA